MIKTRKDIPKVIDQQPPTVEKRTSLGEIWPDRTITRTLGPQSPSSSPGFSRREGVILLFGFFIVVAIIVFFPEHNFLTFGFILLVALLSVFLAFAREKESGLPLEKYFRYRMSNHN